MMVELEPSTQRLTTTRALEESCIAHLTFSKILSYTLSQIFTVTLLKSSFYRQKNSGLEKLKYLPEFKS